MYAGKESALSGKCCPIAVLYPIEGDGGGAVTHVLTLARELRRNGISTFIVFLTDGPSVLVAAKAGLDFEVVEKKFLLDPGPIPMLGRILRNRRVDVLHTHTIRGNYYGRIAALLCQKPIANITTVHSHIPDELRGRSRLGPKDWLLCKRESWLWRFVDHFICVSNKITERLLRDGVAEDMVTVIENAVELPELARTTVHRKSIRRELNVGEQDIVVGTIGRLVPLKNHEMFLRSAEQLLKKRSDIRFVVVGDGPLFQSLVDKSAELGISQHVTFTGWRNDIEQLLSAFDIYVICSVVEGLNVSVLEAMACAKPVVGTDVKGVNEIVMDGRTGILVPSNATDSLADAVLTLAADEKKRLKMGLNGRRLIEEKYSVNNMIHNTMRVYKRACLDLLH